MALWAPSPVQNPIRPMRRHRPWIIAASAVIVAVAIGLCLVAENWPYRYRKIRPLLEGVFGSQVAVARYRRTYFPNPGFIATDVSIRRKSAPLQPPIGTVQTLFVQGHWIDLLMMRERVQLVDMTGVHLVIPAPGSRASQEDFPAGSPMDFTGPDTLIERLEIHNSSIDVLRTNGKRFSFPVRQLHVENMQKGRTMRFAVDMDNAVPYGHIQATGRFGPLNGKSLGATPVSGQFKFDQVRLHDVGNIRGTLSSSGHFTGQLGKLPAEAEAAIPDFAVSDGKPTEVAGMVQCTVNALDGNVVFHSIELKTGATRVDATGSVVGPPKTTDLDILVTDGRAQDLLGPFLHGDVPVTGPVRLHAHAYLAPSGDTVGFFERLHVIGAFEVPAERLTDQTEETSLAAFSERAQGKHADDSPKRNGKPAANADAISSLQGPATIRDAVVTTHNLKFQVAGARATLDGTFNLHTCAAHLVGKVAMQSNISHATTGFKSFLLKPLAPFFKKKKAGAVIPIAVTGTPGHYRVTQDLTHTK